MKPATDADGSSLLHGIRVVDLSQHFAGAVASQFLADYGAEVVMIERPTGTPLRHSAAFEFLARGKQSSIVDLSVADDLEQLRMLLQGADVLIDDFRPGALARIGLDPKALEVSCPHLVHASITGFGTDGPLAHVPGWEALVMARIGALDALSPLADRAGPVHAAVPYCSFSAGHTAVHGILAALLERERSGRGQRVETSLLQAIAGHDIWNWFLRIVTDRYPEAYAPAPHVEDGIPNSALVFRLLVALTSDQRWIQFSQTSSHLFAALIEQLGMGWMFDDPQWSAIPFLDAPEHRLELWDRMLDSARARSLTEWCEVFDAEPDVWAEEFRSGPAVLDHPQLVELGDIVIQTTSSGAPLRQPGPLARIDGAPTPLRSPAPALGEHGLPHWEQRSSGTPRAASPRDGKPPLDGVTILELGLFFAGPFSTALLADLGARVIKVEPIAGEPMRSLAPFPEVGAIKSMQGKESVCVDVASADGRGIVRRLAGSADIVLQSFRAGVAERLGLDADSLRAEFPHLVYVNAQGYGVEGPCGGRPAYAPTIAAASGIACRMIGGGLPAPPHDADLAAIQREAVRMIAATNTAFAQCDGLAALANASSILLGLLARARGKGARRIDTSMLRTAVHANCEDVLTSARPDDSHPHTDPSRRDLLGPCARYRLYEASDGWLFLAAPDERDWDALVEALELDVDGRFSTSASRRRHDAELANSIASLLSTAPAGHWEDRCVAAGVGCLQVRAAPVEDVMLHDVAPAAGIVREVEHPMLGVHPRLASLVRLSRSGSTERAGCLAGQHTDAILTEFGFAPGEIGRLRASGVVA